VKPPDGTLVKRLKKVPYQKQPWRDRYPHLVNVLNEDPGAPVGNVLTCNVFVRCEKEEIAKEARKRGTIENNWSTDSDPGFTDPEKMDFSLREDSPVFEKLPEFEPIPFDRIGLPDDVRPGAK
jgi:hypothetical protein